MKLVARMLEVDAGGKFIVVLNSADAQELGVHPLDRVLIRNSRNSILCIADISKTAVRSGEVGLYAEVQEKLGAKSGTALGVDIAEEPESIGFIRQRLGGQRLGIDGMRAIVNDVIEHHLSDIELTAFVSSLDFHGMSMEEAVALSSSMAECSKKLDLGRKTIVDKHSIGGCPGDKTTMLVVPMVAAAGLTIPKTSSRAITSPAGTADRVESLCPVELGLEEIRRVVKKTNGCMVWGGAVDLAPADDLFIKIEYPLSIDPLLLPSVMSKKKAVNAKHVVIDIPTGRGAKIKTIGEAHALANEFIELGSRLNINVRCGITFGEQPIGYAMGPALEAREALQTICNMNGPPDLTRKAVELAGILFNMTGVDGRDRALHVLQSGKAEKKLREIIAEQGGNPKIKAGDIPVGEHVGEVHSSVEGSVFWIANHDMVRIARAAGTPKDRGAGILLKKKINDRVKKGDVLFEIYAEKAHKLEDALRVAEECTSIGIGRGVEDRMLIDTIPSKGKHKRMFVLER